MKYQIIPIQATHINEFWVAVDSVAREGKYIAFLEGPPKPLTRAFVLEQINNDWPHFVAIENEKIIGWCDISPLGRPVFAHSGVLGMGVIASCRGRGIGNELITAALKKAKLQGLTRIELTVRESNKTAIALYKKFGFVVEGIHRNAVCIDRKYENHVFMALLWI